MLQDTTATSGLPTGNPFFAKLRGMGLLLYCLSCAAAMMLLASIVSNVMAALNLPLLSVASWPENSFAMLFAQRMQPWRIVLRAPILETLLFQMLPVEVAKKLRLPIDGQWLISASLFMLAHFWNNGAASGLTAGLIGGGMLGLTYLVWREVSFVKALLATILTHALYNGMLLSCIYIVNCIKR